MVSSAPLAARRIALATAGLVLALAAQPAAAQQEPEDPSIVPLFVQTCTRPGMDAEEILAGVTSSPEWVETASATVDLWGLEQVPSRLMTSALKRPGTVSQWHRAVNGRELTLVIATMEERSFWHHVCVLFAPEIRSAWPYFDAFEEGMDAIGLSAKSTDLPHYKEFGGRLADRRQAHADIFSRSRAVTTPRTMHLSIVFE
jgi:hypothetical protein